MGDQPFQSSDNMRSYGIMGRPSLRRSLVGSQQGTAGWIAQQLETNPLADVADKLTKHLSGMYLIVECDQQGVSLLSDHLGFLPSYVARSDDDRVLGIGSHVESLAFGSGLQEDLDPVSVAEIFVYNHVTYPFTTRNAIRELPPCSITRISPDKHECTSQILWEPTEPQQHHSSAEMYARLKDALHEAGVDISYDAESIGVLLSGGMDSRVILSSIPEDTQCTALTYCTRENNETRTAAAVADVAGVEHLLVQRSDSYYPGLVARGLDLLGMELRGNCHGLCIADGGLHDRFDVIVGGQLSDTLLKDHFMPFEQRAAVRPKRIKQRMSKLLKGESHPASAGIGHTTGRAGIEIQLVSEIAEAVRARRATRLDQVRNVRPKSASEWVRFWPCSRQDDSAHTLGNLRLFQADTLFAHQAIVEAACDLTPEQRVDGRLADSVFIELMGPLGEVQNANTGLRANASVTAIRRQKRMNRKRARTLPIRTDWNDVETSWVDPVAMQKLSPFWVEARERLSVAESTSWLDDIIARGGHEMIRSYQEDLPSNTNHISMQLALWLDSLGSRIAPALEHAP
jgi:hypothetical protein